MQQFEGKLIAKGMKIALVVSRFNDLITKELLAGAEDCFLRHGGSGNDLDVVWVPGAFEIPLAAQMAAKKNYDAVVCLGAVIRGATPHFDYVAAEVSKGVARVSLESGKPVIFGVITSDTIEQALERAGSKAGNKGWNALLGAIEMVDLGKSLKA
ncbi:MAG: 6,7-dimethyl-8-ribityllumazine synthase [Candidatus Neomarinimicrobiota bacterium]|jgi:6,7-dimethyl-8-ribityllumazine synthase|nr:6,7-dimethyl-8-ribityllumazine synthase [Candidatus Neomarinimicrobiota bacterium]MDD3966540.1 6,7-dimethyl-8-ribityllumazine synthase [Candidatus Neomarinimicrobiota bacterium]MDX9780173.1 6,7-dimethyl-8-ribityllumazine synthase [bacterium]